MIELDDDVVVVGGSIAGVTVVEELLRLGHQGSITLVDAEDADPYARPPLSKAVLSGSDTPESTLLPRLDRSRVQHLRGRRAVGLDVDRGVIEMADGGDLAYAGLVIASGARARTLADLGRNSTGIEERVVRTLDDARELRADVQHASSIAIVGGGVLGMELASVATAMGLHTTVISDEQPLLRLCGTFVSDLVARRARAHGVNIVIDANGAHLVDHGGRLAVKYADSVVEADLVVSAVGDVPNVEWLKTSGVAHQPGVVVDSRCRVSERIVAAGDVVAFGTPPRRSPHWSSAIDQARVAAAALVLGDSAGAHSPRPYFWTDQFDLALKIGGATPFVGEPHVIEGSVAELQALVQWTHGGRPRGALAINKRMPISRLHTAAGNPSSHSHLGANE